MNKIRKGDRIIIITGKDKGKQGIVSCIQNDKVTIEGINIVKKHIKANPTKGIVGGIQNKNMPLHISNIALVDKDGKPSRIGIKIENSKKVRFLKSNGIIINT